jgi:polyribonucleotide nucleotidyltransferase
MPYKSDVIEVKHDFDGRDLIIRTGEYAYQADGAVTVQIGDTIVLATASMGAVRPGTDFLPLMVTMKRSFTLRAK